MFRVKEFLGKPATIRFIRVVVFGVIALVLMQFVLYFSHTELDPSTRAGFIAVITGWIAGLDKHIRDTAHEECLEDALEQYRQDFKLSENGEEAKIVYPGDQE